MAVKVNLPPLTHERTSQFDGIGFYAPGVTAKFL
jgi:hypothetical protein